MKKKLSAEAIKLKKAIFRDFVLEDEPGLAVLDVALRAFDTMHEAQAAVDRDGLTIKGDRGQLRAHPLLTVVRDARSQFLQAMKNLNFDVEPPNHKIGRPGGR